MHEKWQTPHRLQPPPAPHTQWPAPSHCAPSRNEAQAVPEATKPVPVHTGPPELQSICPPATQSLAGVHALPCAHATHVPAPLHTPPGHETPAPALPDTLHTALPLPHAVVPVVHALPVEHAAPAEHGLQVPEPSHTPPGHVAPATA